MPMQFIDNELFRCKHAVTWWSH